MISIPYSVLVAFITILWVTVRAYYAHKQKKVNWAREAQLILVYICIVVVVRFTFIPFGKVDGKLQPLLFDAAQMFPPRINLLPIVYLFDYPVFKEALLNFVGNTAMFVPLGIVFPIVDRRLYSHFKAMAAGVGISLCIEFLQLPFFDRVSDVDDLLLNSLGYFTGYGIYLLVKTIAAKFRERV
jgi:glycopeptide antibiotics resistance protein